MRGHLVNYGQASGPVPPFEISRLSAKSASVTRPGYAHYIADRADLVALAELLWARIAAGTLRAEAGAPYPLAQAADAHRALEARAGPVILIP